MTATALHRGEGSDRFRVRCESRLFRANARVHVIENQYRLGNLTDVLVTHSSHGVHMEMERHSAADYDHHDDTLKGEALYDVYVAMRQECLVNFSDLYGGFYTLTGYDDVRAVAQNHETFLSAHGILVPELDRPPFRALEFDPPVHGDNRKVMVPLLTPGEVSKAEGMIRRNAIELLDAVSSRGECEIIEDFSEPFAVGVIAEVLGITDVAKQRVRELTTDWVRNADTPAGDAAMGAYVAMMIAEVQDRRENPREDALTSMTRVKIRGELLGSGTRDVRGDHDAGRAPLAGFRAGEHGIHSRIRFHPSGPADRATGADSQCGGGDATHLLAASCDRTQDDLSGSGARRGIAGRRAGDDEFRRGQPGSRGVRVAGRISRRAAERQPSPRFR